MRRLAGEIRADILRYVPRSERVAGASYLTLIRTVAKHNSLWIVLVYRVGHCIQRRVRNRLLRVFLKLPYALIARPVNFFHDTHIDVEAEIGEGLYLAHYGGVWIGPVSLGEQCNISHEVTIGFGGSGADRGVPRLGDRVLVSPGAKLFGRIVIGNRVAIGANAVVSKSLPDNAVVVGNPGRIVSYEGSDEWIEVGRNR